MRIRILLLIKGMLIYEHWPAETLHTIMVLHASIVNVLCPVWLHFKPPQLRSFDFDADPDLAFDFDADPDPTFFILMWMRILLPNGAHAKRIRIHNTGCKSSANFCVQCMIVDFIM
jgi:hypothetical protein